MRDIAVDAVFEAAVRVYGSLAGGDGDRDRETIIAG